MRTLYHKKEKYNLQLHMTLFIQTISKNHAASILDEKGNIIRKKTWHLEKGKSEITLKIIDEILEGEKPIYILIVNGKGSYTGTRIGVSIGNSLAFAWNIPIGKITTEEYEGDNENLDSTPLINKFFKNPQWDKTIVPKYNKLPKIG